jgi:hypothetical protein
MPTEALQCRLIYPGEQRCERMMDQRYRSVGGPTQKSSEEVNKPTEFRRGGGDSVRQELAAGVSAFGGIPDMRR